MQEVKENFQAQIDKLHLEIGQYKIDLATHKSSIQDLEDFIEVTKHQVEILEGTLSIKDTEITQLKLDLNTANNKVKSLVKVQMDMRKK